MAEDNGPSLIPVGLQGMASRSTREMKGARTILLGALGWCGSPMMTKETPKTRSVLLYSHTNCLLGDKAVHRQRAAHVGPHLWLQKRQRERH